MDLSSKVELEPVVPFQLEQSYKPKLQPLYHVVILFTAIVKKISKILKAVLEHGLTKRLRGKPHYIGPLLGGFNKSFKDLYFRGSINNYSRHRKHRF